jgi:signal transduction histidine kinase
VTESARAVVATVDTLALTGSARAALSSHLETISRRTTLAGRAETLSRYKAVGLGIVTLLAAILVVGASLHLARRWSGSFAAPIEELIRWVRHIEAREPLPEHTTGSVPPEFEALRGALRQMSAAVEDARRQEVERERLVAFQETARRVAHEIRGPLTSSRLALAQLSGPGLGGDASVTSALGVLTEEVRRLEDMAKEFAELGRLPEGPVAPIDIGELMTSVLTATVPEGVTVQRATPVGLEVPGMYEPLRRAMQNLVRNAVEATGDTGIEISETRHRQGDSDLVRISVADHGPGVPAALHDKIFEPYFTTKGSGTGLGLAMVRQTVQAHGGTIAVGETPGGGATFIVDLPDVS